MDMYERTQRNTYFDFLRGIAMIMVVGIHTFAPLQAGEGEIYDFTANIVRQALNCAVPLFLALSGYFSAKWLKYNRGGIAKQIQKVYVPTILFSLPYFFQDLIYAGTSKIVILDVATLVVCGYSVFYFIAVIIQYYLLTPFLTRIGNRKLLWTSATISSVSVLSVSYLLYVKQLNLPLILYAGPCTLWIAFYSLGIYIRKNNRQYSYTTAVVIMTAGFLLSVIESYQWERFGNISYGIKLSSFIFSAGAILVLFSAKTERIIRPNILTHSIVRVGNLSFGIYLTHMLVVNTLAANHLSEWLVRWLVVLIVSAVLVKLLNWCIPDKYHRLLGIA